jgi:hypothetical protein
MRLNYPKIISFLSVLNVIVCVTSSICKATIKNYDQSYALCLNFLIFIALIFSSLYWTRKVNRQRLEMLQILLSAQRSRAEALDMISDGWSIPSMRSHATFSQKVNWKKEGF